MTSALQSTWHFLCLVCYCLGAFVGLKRQLAISTGRNCDQRSHRAAILLGRERDCSRALTRSSRLDASTRLTKLGWQYAIYRLRGGSNRSTNAISTRNSLLYLNQRTLARTKGSESSFGAVIRADVSQIADAENGGKRDDCRPTSCSVPSATRPSYACNIQASIQARSISFV